ncbi:EVE domain-containing protein [Shewanella sp. A3A]|nr:EVE domain-containing protein [Shewanella ferrihydritica]
MKYWLFKSEPDDFSIDDLACSANQTTFWFGIRNYQARNFIRDELQPGDQILFYHSSCAVPAVVGTAVIKSAAQVDNTAFDPQSPYFDAKSDPHKPRWFGVDIGFLSKFAQPVSLRFIKQDPQLQQMYLVAKGNRLSIQPVAADEWQRIVALGAKQQPA